MRFLFFLFALLHPLLSARVTNTERKLPADIQVDLIFPRNNETYAPMQLLPVVFGIQNMHAVWSIYINIFVEVYTRSLDRSDPKWTYQTDTLHYNWNTQATYPPLEKNLFYFPTFNIANGTTGTFTLGPRDDDGANWAGWMGWSNQKDYAKREILFSTATGAQLPDIEATINSCPEPNEENIASLQSSGFSVGWVLPALAFSISNVL